MKGPTKEFKNEVSDWAGKVIDTTVVYRNRFWYSKPDGECKIIFDLLGTMGDDASKLIKEIEKMGV